MRPTLFLPAIAIALALGFPVAGACAQTALPDEPGLAPVTVIIPFRKYIEPAVPVTAPDATTTTGQAPIAGQTQQQTAPDYSGNPYLGAVPQPDYETGIIPSYTPNLNYFAGGNNYSSAPMFSNIGPVGFASTPSFYPGMWSVQQNIVAAPSFNQFSGGPTIFGGFGY